MYFCFRRGTAIELRIDYIIIILKKKKKIVKNYLGSIFIKSLS